MAATESFITFVEDKLPKNFKTKAWEVISKRGSMRLGYIKWYAPWRKYCFMPEEKTIFDSGCQEEIAKFLRAEMKKRSEVGFRDTDSPDFQPAPHDFPNTDYDKATRHIPKFPV